MVKIINISNNVAMRNETTRGAIFALIGLIIAAVLLLSSCTIQRASLVHTLEMNNLLDSYHETKWNAENNRPGERDSIKHVIKQSLKNYRHE